MPQIDRQFRTVTWKILLAMQYEERFAILNIENIKICK